MTRTPASPVPTRRPGPEKPRTFRFTDWAAI